VPRSCSRVTPDRGHHHQGEGEDDAEQARHDIVGGDVLGVVAAVDDDFERLRGVGRRGDGAVQIVAQGFLRQSGQRGERAAGRGGIGGVGLDQDLGAVAAHHPAGEIARNGDRELDLAGPHQRIELGRRARLVGDVEIGAVGDSGDDRAGEDAVLLHQKRGRQVAGIGVDRIAEQKHLDHRHRQDQGIGDPVAGQLDEFLDQDGQHPVDGEGLGLPSAHWKLSSTPLIRWMNTSSSVGLVGVHLNGARR